MSTLECVSRSGAFSKGGRRQEFSSCFQYNQYTPEPIVHSLGTDDGWCFHSNLSTKGGFSEELRHVCEIYNQHMDISRGFSGGNCASMVTDSCLLAPFSPSLPVTPWLAVVIKRNPAGSQVELLSLGAMGEVEVRVRSRGLDLWNKTCCKNSDSGRIGVKEGRKQAVPGDAALLPPLNLPHVMALY